MRSVPLLLLLVGALGAWTVPATAQSARLLRDLDQRSVQPNPGSILNDPGFADLGVESYFGARTERGSALFATDGTTAGTRVVYEFGPNAYVPGGFARLGNTLFFPMHAPGAGMELWATDGTTSGTRLVRDIRPGDNGASPGNLVVLGGLLYFAATDPLLGRELWRSDGTTSGTTPVVDLYGGPLSGLAAVGTTSADRIEVFNNELYFYADDGLRATLWRSDGTASGTVPVAPGAAFVGARFLTTAGSFLYFTTSTSVSSKELYRTDGTAAGTVAVSVPRPFAPTAALSGLTSVGNRLVFSADDGVHGRELWITAASGATASLLLDINPGIPGSFVLPDGAFASIANRLWFGANDGVSGQELWTSDGTAAGTRQVVDLNPGVAGGIGGARPVGAAGRIYFSGTDSTTGYEPWSTDGTANGTRLLADVAPGSASSSPEGFHLRPDGRLLFVADDGVHGREPWVSDGTTAGTRMLADLNFPPPTTLGSGGASAAIDSLRGFVVLFADDAIHGREPWITDGTPGGTRLLLDVHPGANGSLGTFDQALRAGKDVYFVADDGVHGRELWTTDGSTAGTRMVVDAAPGTTDGARGLIGAVPGGRVLFLGWDPLRGTEPWISDGTPAGTHVLRDTYPGTGGGGAGSVAPTDTRIYYTGLDELGAEPWVTDGTFAGTYRIRDVRVGPAASYPWIPSLPYANHYTRACEDGRAFFVADDGILGAELWVTDGTAAGTHVVVDLAPGPTPGNPILLACTGGTAWFTFDDGIHGRELWRTDGTAAGTFMVFDAWPGIEPNDPVVGTPGAVLPLGRGHVFHALAASSERALWFTDGSPAGTVRLTPPGIDLGDSEFRLVAGGARRIYFPATDARRRTTLWETDGTPSGTRPVPGLPPELADSDPAPVLAFGGRLLFNADDGVHGTEPWVLELGASSLPVGRGSGLPFEVPHLDADDLVLGAVAEVRGRGGPPNGSAVTVFGWPTGEVVIGDFHHLYLTDPTVLAMSLAPGGRFAFPVVPPATPALSGLTIALQTFFGPTATPFGLSSTNGVHATLGIR